MDGKDWQRCDEMNTLTNYKLEPPHKTPWMSCKCAWEVISKGWTPATASPPPRSVAMSLLHCPSRTPAPSSTPPPDSNPFCSNTWPASIRAHGPRILHESIRPQRCRRTVCQRHRPTRLAPSTGIAASCGARIQSIPTNSRNPRRWRPIGDWWGTPSPVGGQPKLNSDWALPSTDRCWLQSPVKCS